MNKFEYKNLTPFKWFVLENFPFIEADFDALTEWQLFCKLGKEINKIINSTNTLGIQVESLTDYVKNYFDNLDVQEEINNKLNEMAQSGQLQEIIGQYINLHGVLAFDDNNAMKSAANLVDGSICKTLGNTSYLDGKGAFYRVRPIQNTDIVDGNNIVALYNKNLIAEKINYSSNYDLQNQINEIKRKKTMIVIGDSFSNSSQSGTPLWYNYVAKALNLNVYTNASDGQGYGTGSNNFLKQLETANNYFTDKSIIDRIYIVGGLNDLGNTSGIPDSLTFGNYATDVFNYANQYFPNIPVYVYGILPFQFYNYYGNNIYLSKNRATSFTEILSYYAIKDGMIFTQCSSFGLFSPDYFGQANEYNQMHPSALGEKAIANLVLTGQRFYGVRNVNNNNQCPTLNTQIPIVSGIATSVEIIGTDLNNIYIRVNGYQNTEELKLNVSNLPIEFNYPTEQYDFPVTDEVTTIYAYGSIPHDLTIPPNKLKNGALYINVPYNPLW